MVEIIFVINVISAIASIYGWIKRSPFKAFPITVLACNLISVSMAINGFTAVSLVILVVAVVFLVLIYTAKQYVAVEENLVTAQVHYDGVSKKEMFRIQKECQKGYSYDPIKLSEGIRFAADKGIALSDLVPLIRVSKKLSIAVSTNLQTATNLIILLSRMFDESNFTTIADKITVTYKKGVLPGELETALQEYKDECYMPETIKMDELLAAIITLAEKEFRGEYAGQGMAQIINALGNSGDSI
ncbi:MAG: hypothetical protein P9L99_05500 [Candidatus Lernaella stagnicola]|nr:hypothetical protein [Candidatus Lernaella stagnicola]